MRGQKATYQLSLSANALKPTAERQAAPVKVTQLPDEERADAKRCTRCGETKALGEFSERRTGAGSVTRRSHCRACVTEAARAKRARRAAGQEPQEPLAA